ncbi:hypothetical protein [Rhodococcus sp. 14-2496-1d]|nr:hypothetical protein [Rhodococcus sp. 14-2496-1d]
MQAEYLDRLTQVAEAGDPVQVGPIRTTNSGMGFKGFYRPTE